MIKSNNLGAIVIFFLIWKLNAKRIIVLFIYLLQIKTKFFYLEKLNWFENIL